MKKLILVLLVLVSFSGFSQKVKLKKEKVVIDDVDVYNYQEERSSITFSTLSSKEFITVFTGKYDERNAAHYNQNDPYAHNYPATRMRYVFTVKFLESGKELFTDLDYKEFIKVVFKANLVDEDGKIDAEKLNFFINKYNNENLKLKLSPASTQTIIIKEEPRRSGININLGR